MKTAVSAGAAICPRMKLYRAREQSGTDGVRNVHTYTFRQ